MVEDVDLVTEEAEKRDKCENCEVCKQMQSFFILYFLK